MSRRETAPPPFEIGDLRIDPPVALAPLAGYSHLPFRRICRRLHCGLVFTEMTMASGIVRRKPQTMLYLESTPDERPVAAHLYGAEADVLAEADYVGSTAGMIREVDRRRPQRVLMVTECSMSDNVAVEFPAIEFVRPCNLCPHMKMITLPKILRSLQSMDHVVEVDPAVSERARQAVLRMLENLGVENENILFDDFGG